MSSVRVVLENLDLSEILYLPVKIGFSASVERQNIMQANNADNINELLSILKAENEF